jgi:hypothetical protein
MSYGTQRDRLLAFLEARRGQWIPLPEILGLGIAQYNARIFELRGKGHDIRMRDEWKGRMRHTWYRLEQKQGQSAMF